MKKEGADTRERRSSQEQPSLRLPARSPRELVCLFVLVASYEVTGPLWFPWCSSITKPWGAGEKVRSQHLSFLRDRGHDTGPGTKGK